jgi:hypothetical protein
MRDDSGGTRAGQLPNLFGQVGLIEIAKFCGHSRAPVKGRYFHALQQGLEPHNPREALGRKANPIALIWLLLWLHW